MKDYPKHPKFDFLWPKYRKLLYWWAKKISKRCHFLIYPKDLYGSLVLCFNIALHRYDKNKINKQGTRTKFSSYFSAHITSTVFRVFLNYDSDHCKLSGQKRLLTPVHKMSRGDSIIRVKHVFHYDYKEFERIPFALREKEERHDWLAEITKCFPDQESFWKFVFKTLLPREQEIVYKAFVENKNNVQIGREFATPISKERVRQLLARALWKLKKHFGILDSWHYKFKI